MNPGDWIYEPDHAYVDHLDDVFRQGNAPRLAGMLQNLANPSTGPPYLTPCYLDIPAILVVAPNDGEFPSSRVQAAEQFFSHADILTGQNVGKLRDHLGTKLDRLDVVDGGYVAEAVEALDATRTGEATTLWTDIDRVFLGDATGPGTIWHDWIGDAATQARPKFQAVGKWFAQEGSDGEFRQRALRDLSEILIRYAATIHGARMNIDNLMGELVDEIDAWNSGGDTSKQHPGNWVSLSGINDLSKATPIGVAFHVIDSMMAAAAETSNEKELKDNQVYFKLDSFLTTADELLRDTVEQVDAITGGLDRVREGRHVAGFDIPVWPT